MQDTKKTTSMCNSSTDAKQRQQPSTAFDLVVLPKPPLWPAE